jgi:Protein of unknown function (DUF2591)
MVDIMKTAELVGAALDWAVAKCEGQNEIQLLQLRRNYPYDFLIGGGLIFRPSTNWSDGGPIIEREKISIVRDAGDDYWQAVTDAESGSMFGLGIAGRNYRDGSTPLMAAMRCYVAFKLGEEVEIPEELL